MEYIGVLLLLIGTLLVYFRIANHFNIIDKPTIEALTLKLL